LRRPFLNTTGCIPLSGSDPEGEDFPFREEIAKAQQRKEEAKYAVIAHRQEHGC